jgi:hypothetical protein
MFKIIFSQVRVKMVLCQFLLREGDIVQNNRDFVVPISGKCSIRVLGLQVWDSDSGNNHCHPLQIQSDVLFFPYSPQRYLTFLSHQTNTHTVDSGFKEYNIYATIPGKIHLNLIDVDTGEAPDHDINVILTLELELLNRDFDVER